jgi:hypothetical protein
MGTNIKTRKLHFFFLKKINKRPYVPYQASSDSSGDESFTVGPPRFNFLEKVIFYLKKNKIKKLAHNNRYFCIKGVKAVKEAILARGRIISTRP